MLLVVLASWTAQAQQRASCLKLSKIKIADLLHQSGETRAELTFKAHDCYVVQRRELAAVMFENKPGLQAVVSSTGFGHFDQESVGTPTVNAQEMSLVMTLKASPDLPVGEHSLHAMLTYQRLDSSGVPTPETIAFQVPFKVAPAKVYKPPKEKSAFVKGLETAGLVVVAIPAILIMMVWCPISGECPSC